jgi:uncharacterized membrane protein
MFDGAHIHLLLNHIPILGPAFILPLLLWGVLRKNRTLAMTGLIMTVAVALMTIPAFITGEDAEEAVEGIIGVSEVNIEEHEEQGEIAYYAMLMAGAIALGAVLSGTNGKPFSGILLWITIAALAVVFVLMARVGNSGGKIRHTEIYSAVSVQDNKQGEDDD